MFFMFPYQGLTPLSVIRRPFGALRWGRIGRRERDKMYIVSFLFYMFSYLSSYLPAVMVLMEMGR